MIDIFTGALLAGICIGWLAVLVWNHWPNHEGDTTWVQPMGSVQLPELPRTPTLLKPDGHRIEREDLYVIAVLLDRAAHAWMASAYDAVVAQIAADEAEAGLAEVEDAANREAS